MAEFNLYNVYFPVLSKALNSIDDILDKAQEYAKEKNLDVDTEYFHAALIEDMYPFVKQIHNMTGMVKVTISSITGLGPEDWPAEKTFAELSARVQKTRDLLNQVAPEHLNGRENEVIVFSLRANSPEDVVNATILHMLQAFTLPNVFFHLVTAYDILRMKGVPLGKVDYAKSFMAE